MKLYDNLEYAVAFTVLNWANQVAAAMRHLHDRDKPLVHADLKADNGNCCLERRRHTDQAKFSAHQRKAVPRKPGQAKHLQRLLRPRRKLPAVRWSKSRTAHAKSHRFWAV